jgi:hypothetical protein
MRDRGAALTYEPPLDERSTPRLLGELLWPLLCLTAFVGLSFLKPNAEWVRYLVFFAAGVMFGLYLMSARGHVRELIRRC